MWQSRTGAEWAGQDDLAAGVGTASPLPRIIAWAVFGVASAFGVLYIVATAYLFLHDDVVRAALRIGAEFDRANEDRIAALRLQIDRLASRQVLDQAAIEGQIATVMQQQQAIVDQASRVSALAATARDLGIVLDAAPGTNARPWLWSSPTPTKASVGQKLSAIEAENGRLEALNARTVTAIAMAASARIQTIHASLTQLGITPPAVAGNVGGPFIPVTGSSRVSVGDTLAVLGTLRATLGRLSSLPLRTPLRGDMIQTSSFGTRQDPFLGVAALHSGVDLRAETGTAVQATAPGIVIDVGWRGGYGNQIEIDHGNGLTTRYGHLSRIGVALGESIAAGQTIGEAGSTGRSTGPHLHYETRINGDAVDPAPWLETGQQYAAYLR